MGSDAGSSGSSGPLREAVAGFDSNAAAYERARPSYPAEAVAYVVGRGAVGPGRRVLDLAAGTGKLTRLLVPTGAAVVAVEPVAGMRAQLTDVLAGAAAGAGGSGSVGVEVLDGTAESLPLPAASVDAVTVAQAFHWFDPAAALAEIARVLRPGGSLFLVWNTRDRSVDWVRRFGELLVDGPDLERPYDAYYEVDYADVVASAGGDLFTPVEVWAHDWVVPTDEDLLVARAESVSVVGVLAPDERVPVLDRVRRLVRTHPDLAGRGWFPFPYTTRVWWCRRRA
jgi:ubiquinone/menaquinone biosynthesis C-methylase UbiE